MTASRALRVSLNPKLGWTLYDGEAERMAERCFAFGAGTPWTAKEPPASILIQRDQFIEAARKEVAPSAGLTVICAVLLEEEQSLMVEVERS